MNSVIRWLLPCLLLWTTAPQAAPAFPALSGRVVDGANLMSPKQSHQLSQQLADFEQRSGIQLVVVSVDSLEGDTIEEYGYQLGRHWGIGQKQQNNGVLLLIAQNERKVRIEVGYGLEGALPDAIAANIIQSRILPAFHRGDMVAGIVAGSQSIMQALAGEYKPRDSAKKEHSSHGPWLFILMMMAMLVLHRLRSGRSSRAAYLIGGVGGGYSRGGGGRSRGGGGGFSGGGGSFGGGGASGGW